VVFGDLGLVSIAQQSGERLGKNATLGSFGRAGRRVDNNSGIAK
jgi:hypothetical protein